MHIAREPFAVVGIFFVVAGILLALYGPTHGLGAALPFGLLYAAGGVGMVAFSFLPKDLR